MPETIYAQPDLAPDGATPTGDSGTWAQILDWINHIPTIAWVTALAVLTTATVLAVPFLRSQAFKAGTRQSKKTLTEEDRRDRRLLIAALIPASLFWIAVLTGSGRGLIAFGREDLHWHGGWEFLVPFTLDGVAIAFALLAFRAVRKGMNPDRAVRISAAAMLASAGINFLHEVGGSKLGAGYLAILSLLGMLIFDEFLAQFEEGADNVRRTNPKFGLRWITWPTNTACAWVAWRNHPPAPDLKATVGNAVQHLEKVRADKTASRAQRVDTPQWWVRVVPWLHLGALRLTLAEQRRTAETERARSAALAASHREAIEARDRSTEQMAEQFRQEAERATKAWAEREAQLLREAAERLATERAEHAAELDAIRADKLLRLPRSEPAAPRPTSKNTAVAKPPAPARMSDTEALRSMFQEHPEPGYAWTDREVNRITGAGFSSRAPRLTGLAVKHLAECPEQSHKACYTERSGSGSDDPKEQSA